MGRVDRAMAAGRTGWIAWVPVIGLAVILVTGAAWSPKGSVEPVGLLPALNLVFLTVMPLVGAVLAIDAYRRTGVVAVLAVGTALLIGSVGAGVLPGLLLTTLGADGTLTLHNTSTLLAAACHAAGAIAAARVLTASGARGRHVAIAYGLAVVLVASTLGLYLAGVTPPFWSNGPTELRQTALRLAIVLMAVSAFGWWQTSSRDPAIPFLRWYVPGLTLGILGLVALLLSSVLGDLLNWVGRTAQYLSGAYLLLAIATEVPFRARAGNDTSRHLGISLLQAGLPLRPLVESTSDAVIALAPHGRVVYWNDAARRLFGQESDEAFDRPVGELLVTADDSPAGRARLGEIVDPPVAAATSSHEIWLLDGRGMPVPVELRRFASPDDTRIVVLVATDISSRVSAQEQLEDRVRERTAALESANAELERANHAKDEFLGLVSHELKTPITTILTAANLLARRSPDEDGILGDLAGEAGRLAAVVDNLLMLARLEAGQTAEREPVALERIVRRGVEQIARDHAERDISVSCDPGLVVDGNDTQLEMVLRNLLSNAIKYGGPSGAIRVEACGTATEAVVVVADEGPAFREADPSILFEPFYRSTSSSVVPGVGIGLAVCRRIIESMGGTIEARVRTDRRGAEFRFSLPLLEVDAEAETDVDA